MVSRASSLYSVSPTGAASLITASATQGIAPGLVSAGDGNLYVSDRNFSTINRITPAGVVTVAVSSSDSPIGTVLGGLPGKINSPAGMALLSTGTSVSLAPVHRP